MMIDELISFLLMIPIINDTSVMSFLSTIN